jgi:hypothetical protein
MRFDSSVIIFCYNHMKKYWILLLVLGLAAISADSVRNNYRSQQNNRFALGEKLTYLVHYGPVNGGEAVVEMDPKYYVINNRVCYKVNITGKTIGFVKFTYDVNDTWQSYIDTAAIIPHRFYRNIKENDYRKVENVYFDQSNGKVSVKSVTGSNPEKSEYYKVPENVQDIVSGYYYLRTLNFDRIKVNDTLTIDGFFEDKVYKLQVVYQGKEKLPTKFGNIWASVVSPVMPENELFDGRDAIKFWISDDPNRVPIKIQAKMFVGALELDLIEHKGLRHKFKKK